MFELLKDCWNYLFNPKTSLLLVMAETDATAAEQRAKQKLVEDWGSIKDTIERNIRVDAELGCFQYVVSNEWSHYFERGGIGRAHFKELGFKVRSHNYGLLYAIHWGRRPNEFFPSKSKKDTTTAGVGKDL